jgi:S-(hydroxymethyl)glutathione dehydrogenase/alcohol dehydrogenase
MRALVLEGAGALRAADLTLPDPAGDQVRVRLTASGVCHSDLHARDGDWTVPLPLVLGHEGAGVVEAIGPDVRDVAVGDHVVLSWFAPCRRCMNCAAGRAWLCTGTRALEHPCAAPGFHAFLGLGTFAEATVVPESAAVAIDPAVPAEVAALIGCSVATGVGAVLNTARVGAGESAVVVGCGGVGQAIVLGLVLAGADPIVAVDLDPGRREQALALGATRAVAAADAALASDGDAARACGAGGPAPSGFDHAFEAIGVAATLEAMPGLLARGGQAVIVGMPAEGVRIAVDPFDLADQGKRLVGCNYGSSVPAVDFPRLARLYLAGRLPLDRLVGARRPLEEAGAALDDLRAAIGLRTVLCA